MQNLKIQKSGRLNENIARNLGIGNSTGLGMAPFIVNHPTLCITGFIVGKALKQIRSIEKVTIKILILSKIVLKV